MNRAIVALVVGFMFAGGLAAAEEKTTRSISVTGTVETTTAPDLVVWSISLSDADNNLQEAKKRSDQKVKSVIALREKLGIADGDLEAGYVYVRRQYEREREQPWSRGVAKGYVVSRSVTIRQRDLKRFDEYLDALISSADMEVNFRFESSRMRDVRSETRLKALQVAQVKAEAMAQALGAKAGKVLSINEHLPGERWGPEGLEASNTAVLGSSPPSDVGSDKFVPGALTVRVSVSVTFELE